MTEPNIDAAPDLSFDLRALPKVSLHDHLDGGLRPATIIELAAEIGHELPSTDPVALGQWFRDAADSGSLPRYLETFDHTIAVMQTAPALRRIAREFVEDLADDGVVYGEVRWAPEQHLTDGLTLDEAVEAVQAGLEDGMALVEESGRVIAVGQLITAMRHADNSQAIAELAVRHRDRGAVGFDIAGAEDGFPPSRFAEAFTYLAQNNFPATVHAGEAAGLASIQSALVDGRALRLGHGVRIAEDITVDSTDEVDEDGVPILDVTLGELAAWVRDRGIPLELCPSSNLQTGAIAAWGEDILDHPFDMLYELGFNVTVNTDNRLMSGVTLTDEFELLVEAFDYDLDDLLEITLNAAEAAFLPLEDREDLVEYINEAYANLAE
ncbi:Adenosine deaminase [Sinomonas atrocyanea]|uniref:adenosine deaminase n=1 Tax=Sinomonas atrocyanea TaxID=37927 RepID=A0A126ZY97_9MICC|nr:adenosine deaminase [Sinomonas atrocyanea]AMM32073.1 Adenosine deaminase [Sinomonas atrocyanea]GEB65243.1 adenosine deaminase 1 [Sinomonas atrocyanea]GGG56088.1 adenosine deaminase 1 [Sinomonas atrocyanea]